METNIQNLEAEPSRKSRANWFLIAAIILLGIVSLVQGVILFGIKSDRSGRPPGRAWQQRLQNFLPGLAVKSRQAPLSLPENQVVFWETTDDLEQIHDQINRLLRNMSTPFPGMAMQRKSGNWPPAMPLPDGDLGQLQREIGRIFDVAYDESQRNTLLSRFNRGWDMVSSAVAMNIEDQGSNYVVTVALPGYDKQAIMVGLEGHLLIIEAEQAERPPEAATLTNAGRFRTQIMMPENIEGAGAQAVYDHDVLCVHIPKAAGTNSLVRSIAIR